MGGHLSSDLMLKFIFLLHKFFFFFFLNADEGALVDAAARLGFKFIARTPNYVELDLVSTLPLTERTVGKSALGLRFFCNNIASYAERNLVSARALT